MKTSFLGHAMEPIRLPDSGFDQTVESIRHADDHSNYPFDFNETMVRSAVGAVFIRKKVADDGDCGFTAFGITRQDTIDLLLKNILNQKIVRLLQQPLREVMFQKKFSEYIEQHNMFPNYTTISNQLIEAETYPLNNPT